MNLASVPFRLLDARTFNGVEAVTGTTHPIGHEWMDTALASPAIRPPSERLTLGLIDGGDELSTHSSNNESSQQPRRTSFTSYVSESSLRHEGAAPTTLAERAVVVRRLSLASRRWMAESEREEWDKRREAFSQREHRVQLERMVEGMLTEARELTLQRSAEERERELQIQRLREQKLDAIKVSPICD